MSCILLLGGYGGFGGRIAHRLAAAGHEVLVAGRSLDKAREFCAGAPGLSPLRLDRADIAEALGAYRPDILVDASGPFQGMDHTIPVACIAARIHYVDIADSRAFVCAIGALDDDAKAAGVVVVSGASSVPALSGAVVRHLAAGMDRVRAVEMAISASNRATAGPAVAAAILGQVGQPMPVWKGQRWEQAFGWQSMCRMDFRVAGVEPIAHRMVALADVPDIALLPENLPGRPAVTFRAGAELALQNFALWSGGLLVRAGLLGTLRPFARWIEPWQSITRNMGSDRSAMVVRVFGDAGGTRTERRWTLIADNGDGPEIPALSVAPIIARILAGLEPAGARHAAQILSLDDYGEAFAGLSIRHACEEMDAGSPLYARVMGERFHALPEAVRAMHDILRDGGAAGEADVEGPSGLLAAMIARIFGFPPAGRHQLHVSFEETGGRETWTRDFGGKRFRSHLGQRDGMLTERFGPFRFAFDLPSDDQGLSMILRRWWFGPLRLPVVLAPRSEAREWAEGGRFHFDVSIALPLVGRLVRYRGWLVPART